MYPVAYIPLCWLLVLIGLVAYVIAIVLALGYLAYWRRRELPAAPVSPRPGVSILKPLCGRDDELEANLESFFALAYEPLEILVGTRTGDDPALAVARAVAARYPDRAVRFLTDLDSDAANPKIAIDEHLLRLARYPLVLLSDSNVRIGPGDLERLVGPLQDDRVGMVYQPVACVGARDYLAAFENARLTEHSGVLTIAARVFAREDAITGKGMLCRRSALASIGDLDHVRHVGLDDYLLGVALRKAGWRLHLSTLPARNVVVERSFQSFVDRHLRHAVWRLSLYPWLPVAELLMMPITWALAALVAGGPGSGAAAVFALGTKAVLEFVASRALVGHWPPLWHGPLMPLKDAVMLVIWALAVFRHSVVWRGRTYSVGRRSRLCTIGTARA